MNHDNHIAVIALKPNASQELIEKLDPLAADVKVDVFTSIQDAQACLSQSAHSYIACILDADTQIEEGLAFLNASPTDSVNTTLFICTHAPREMVLKILSSGAAELIDKDPDGRYLDFLPHSLNRIIEHQKESHARAEAEKALTSIADSLSEVSGKEFFRQLTQRLTSALSVDYALVGELRGMRKKKVRVISASDCGTIQQNYEYLAEDRPSADIIDGKACLIEKNLSSRFPNDKYLEKMGFQSYAGVPLRDNAGEIRGILSILDRKPLQNPEMVQAALKLFAARAEIEMDRVRVQDAIETQARMLDQIGMAILCTETDGTIKSWNQHAEDLLGYLRTDILGKSLDTILPHIDMDALSTQVLEPLLIRGHVNMETVLKRDDDQDFDAAVTFSLEKSPKEEITGIIICCRDITERRRALRKQKEAQQRLAFHINHTSLAFIEWDMERRITAWNSAAEKIFGYKPDEIIGHSFDKIVPPELIGTSVNIFAQLAHKSGGERSTNENIRANGEKIICEWHNTALFNEKDEVIGFASLVDDITERIQNEQKLRESEEAAARANRSKDEFLAVMSHEIRTPMNSIIGFADLLLETQVDSSQQDNLEIIKSNAYQLLELINNVLNYSRLDSGHIVLETRDMDLPALLFEIEEAMGAEASQKNLKLKVVSDPNLPRYIRTSYLEIRQVLLSLVSNAIKFTNQGTIELSVTGTTNANPKGPETFDLCFAVKDTGIGIAEEHLDRIFATFSQVDSSSTRRYGGTGLGLAICRRICELLGGRVWAKSELGKGSTFFMELTAEAVPSRGRSLPPLPIISDPDSLAGYASAYPSKILIADDEEETCRLLGDMLKEMGYKPQVAMGGLDCIEKMQDENFDLIFMDVAMPDINGIETTELIRAGQGSESNKDVFICAITAYADGDDRQRCLDAGMNDHLGKPLITKSLIRIIKKASHYRLRVN